MNGIYEKLPKTTRAGELRVGDVQIFSGCTIRITKIRWSRSGRTLFTTVRHECDPCTNDWAHRRNWLPENEQTWGRQRYASAQRVIRRPIAWPIIDEDPV